MRLGYVNVNVSDFDRAVAFYRDALALPLNFADEKFGYASFDTGQAQLAVIKTEEQVELIGRHTGIGLMVDDVDAAHKDLVGRGVSFTMQPSKQPWGGYMAMFQDPDGNIFYLDQPMQEQP